VKASVLSLDGKKLRDIELPKQFEAAIEPVLIRRAVLSIQSARLQPKGNNPKAGFDNTALYRGYRGLPAYARTINIEAARLPRLKNRRGLASGKVAQVSHAVGGPAAHPPRAEKVLLEGINKAEKRKAVESAIAATAVATMVKKRGHSIEDGVALPLVVEDSFESLKKTREVVKALEALNVFGDVENAKAKKRIRAGKGKRRGRKYKRKKSLLIVTAKKAQLFFGARNLEGVDVVEARNLNAELLAPGAVPGRLTVWTEGAIKALGKRAA
jgi:large subunit ribosomal protein L4e